MFEYDSAAINHGCRLARAALQCKHSRWATNGSTICSLRLLYPAGVPASLHLCHTGKAVVVLCAAKVSKLAP
jgi:hypothetical protein